MENQNKEYLSLVAKGKSLLKTVVCYQATLAAYTLKVCTISHGGRAGSKFYTLTDYAKDLGMNKKTLSEWVSTYKIVIKTVGLNNNNCTMKDWEAANRVMKFLGMEKRVSNNNGRKERGVRSDISADRIKTLFGENYSKRSASSDVKEYIRNTLQIKNKLQEIKLDEIDDVDLIALKEHLDAASHRIYLHFKGKAKKAKAAS
jgi:hypothetical protein